MVISESKLSELIKQAAENENEPRQHREQRPFSPGYIVVTLCGEKVDDFDTYYFSAQDDANILCRKIRARIKKAHDDARIDKELELAKTKLKILELESQAGK